MLKHTLLTLLHSERPKLYRDLAILRITLLHSERPNLFRDLAILSAIGVKKLKVIKPNLFIQTCLFAYHSLVAVTLSASQIEMQGTFSIIHGHS